MKELHEVTKRIEKLSKSEHDLMSEVHPKVSEIKDTRRERSGCRLARKELTPEILVWPSFVRPVKVRGALADLFRMQITALGDSALIVRVRDQFEDAPEETLNEVFRAFHLLRDAEFPALLTSRRLIPASQFSLIRSSSRK